MNCKDDTSDNKSLTLWLTELKNSPKKSQADPTRAKKKT